MNNHFTAKDIIYRFINNSYLKSQVIIHETDAMYKPDIATITRDLRVNEYEIKVSLADLRKELDYIDFVISDHSKQIPIEFDDGIYDMRTDETYEARLNRQREYSESCHKKYRREDNKYLKHRHYIFNEVPHYMRDMENAYRPNRFYFLIPKELYEKEKQRLDAIPMYGVIDAQYFYSLKKCRQIHKGTVGANTVWQAALNLSNKVIYEKPI